MTLKCGPIDDDIELDSAPTRVPWTKEQRTRLASIAKARRVALSTQAEMYRAVDPIAAVSNSRAAQAQQYWETLVFEAGQLGTLNPRRSKTVQNFLAEWIGGKILATQSVRTPLVRARRIASGLLRETGIYTMHSRMQDFTSHLRALTKETGVKFDSADVTRILEEGLTPARLSVYGNTEAQQATLLERFNKFSADMLERGLTQDQLEELLNQAQSVSSTWDELAAVQTGMGVQVGELFNIGYVPRVLSETGLSLIENSRNIFRNGGESLFRKSRTTFDYIVEDHALVSEYLGLTGGQLAELIAEPSALAEYLSKAMSSKQLDLLVDSGLMSKVPMLTTDVLEMLTRNYDLPPEVGKELFIADPVKATAETVRKLTTQVQNSALIKLIHEQGSQAGWVITPEMKDADSQFANFVSLNSIVGDSLANNRFVYVHPDVAQHLRGLIKLSESPTELNNASRIWQWLIRSFRLQALGNPASAPFYLGRQLMSGMISVVGAGASLHHYFTSIVDMIRLGSRGIDAFDNTRPYRIVDGKTVTQRDFIKMVMRNASLDVIPDLQLREGSVFNFDAFNPKTIRKQLASLHAAGAKTPAYAEALGRILNGQHDAVLTPALKIAQILDVAGQLAVLKGRSVIPGMGGVAEGVAQTVLGLSMGKKQTWAELQDLLETSFPMLDDAGKLAHYLSYVAPFQTWAIANVPVQLTDMMRRPTRWANFARAHVLWNDAAYGDDEPVQGEMHQWEIDSYGIVLRRDSETKQTVLMMPNNFDPKWGTLTWMAEMFPQELTAEQRRNQLEGTDTQKFFANLAGQTYLSGVYKIASGIDPLTGVRRNESPLTFQQFANIPMPAWMAAVLSLSPVAASVDRLPIISGTREVEDPRTGKVLIPAVQGWLGNAGTLPPDRLQGLERTVQMLGAKTRLIDGLSNMRYTERDVEVLQAQLLSKFKSEQLRLAEDLRTGAVPRGSDTERKRIEALHLMVDSVLQLNVDLARIKLWAARNNLPSSRAMTELRNRNIAADGLPLPGSEYMQQQIQKAMELK